MKLTSILLALLFLVGTVFSQTTSPACVGKLIAIPSSLTFDVTKSPSAPQTYELLNCSIHPMVVHITPSMHTQLSIESINHGEYFKLPISTDVIIKAGHRLKVRVEVQTIAPITTLNETIVNSSGITSEYSAPVKVLGSAPLPIQLSSFKATVVSTNSVSVLWTTLSETNNYGFYVQRDGTNVTFIPGHGTSLERHDYAFTDKAPYGTHQYRLLQVDIDGTQAYSDAFTIEVKGQFTLNQNYPNPFNPTSQITFAVTKAGQVSLKVYDVTGREVATVVNEFRNPGQYTEMFDGSKLASGIYMYVLRSGEGQKIGRMVLSK